VFSRLYQEKKISSQLLVTGEKSYYCEAFKTLIQKASAAGAVKELGYVSDRELVALMKNSKALIYPSKYEGFGMPPIEAMSAGCPVITTPFTSIPEVCGEAALYIDPDNKKEFADAILALATKENLRKELILKGKKQVQKYSWNKSALIFLDNIIKANAAEK
jgi:glycosyltransferase involved in cell wall biosynthesis